MDWNIDNHGGRDLDYYSIHNKSGKGVLCEAVCANEKKLNGKSLSSSTDSVYELVAEEQAEIIDNHVFSVDDEQLLLSELEESDDHSIDNGMNPPDSVVNKNLLKAQDDCAVTDDLFIVIDDDASDAQEEKSGCEPATAKDCEKSLSDGDDFEMDEIIAEFAGEESKKTEIPSDSEMDSILKEFAESQSHDSDDARGETELNDIILSEVDEEMESILEDFTKESDSDDDICILDIDSDSKSDKEKCSVKEVVVPKISHEKENVNMRTQLKGEVSQNSPEQVQICEEVSIIESSDPSDTENIETIPTVQCSSVTSVVGSNVKVTTSTGECIEEKAKEQEYDEDVTICSRENISEEVQDGEIIDSINTFVEKDDSIIEIDDSKDYFNSCKSGSPIKEDSVPASNGDTVPNLFLSNNHFVKVQCDELINIESDCSHEKSKLTCSFIVDQQVSSVENDAAISNSESLCVYSPNRGMVNFPENSNVTNESDMLLCEETVAARVFPNSFESESVEVIVLDIVNNLINKIHASNPDYGSIYINDCKQINKIESYMDKFSNSVDSSYLTAKDVEIENLIATRACIYDMIFKISESSSKVGAVSLLQKRVEDFGENECAVRSAEVSTCFCVSPETCPCPKKLLKTSVESGEAEVADSEPVKLLSEIITSSSLLEPSSFSALNSDKIFIGSAVTENDTDQKTYLENCSFNKLHTSTEKNECASSELVSDVLEIKEKLALGEEQEESKEGNKIDVMEKIGCTDVLKSSDEKAVIPIASFSVKILHADDSEAILPDEVKKRKVEELESMDTDVKVKRYKEENETQIVLNALNSLEVKTYSNDVTVETKYKAIIDGVVQSFDDIKAKEKVSQLLPKDKRQKYTLKKSHLDLLARETCTLMALELLQKQHYSDLKITEALREKSNLLTQEVEFFQFRAAEYMSTQQTTFTQHGFKCSGPLRTVGVNVKIYRECDLKNALPSTSKLQLNYPAEVSGDKTIIANPAFKKPLPLTETSVLKRTANDSMQLSVPVFKKPFPENSAVRPFQRTPNMPSNVIRDANQQIQAIQQALARRAPLPRIISHSPRPVAPGAMPQRFVPVLPNANMSGNRLVSVLNTGNRLQGPNLAQSVVFVPANKSGSQVALGNAVQVPRSPSIPPIPSSLLGGRTVAYIVPPNSGQLTTFGGRALQPFLPSSNQRVQFVVRVTNPTNAAPVNSVVNTTTRMPMSPQSSQSAAQKSNSLILISRTVKHPAPLPQTPIYPPNSKIKALPPKPSLKGSKAPNGIILSWNMSLFSTHADISTYQLFAYQETNGPVNSSLWKKVGDVKALPLPMACTLTQFVEGHRYFFTVRAVDVYSRCGPFSDPVSIMYASKEAAKDSTTAK